MGKGFLRRGASEEETNPDKGNEELYERLFPKIGRDFVHKEDLQRMLQGIMLLIDPLGLSPIDTRSDVEARRRALEYKAVLDSGKDGTKLYKDLIRLDDDEEEFED